MCKRKWVKVKDKDIEIIKREYSRLGTLGLKSKYSLHLSKQQIRSKAQTLGLKVDTNSVIYKKAISERAKEKFKDKEFLKKFKNIRRKYDFYDDPKQVIKLYLVDKLSCKEIAMKLNVKDGTTILNFLNQQKVKLRHPNYNCKIWEEKDESFLKDNYFEGEQDFIMDKLNTSWVSVMKKARRLNLERSKKFQSQGTTNFNVTNNPVWRPEVREKISKGILEYINKNPDKLLNRILRRNHMTSLEKRVKKILNKHNVSYVYNHYVKTKKSYKFPDFRVANLIIECDGKRFHKDKVKETKRDRELIVAGYSILHFPEDMINKNIIKVERCIVKKLNQLNLLAKNKLMI